MELFTEGILKFLLEVLGIIALASITYITPKVKRWFAIVADKDNSGIITSVVDMGVELAEKELTGKSGELKFNQATDYVVNMLGRYGIEVTREFVAGAVQSGWRRMDDKQKGGNM